MRRKTVRHDNADATKVMIQIHDLLFCSTHLVDLLHRRSRRSLSCWCFFRDLGHWLVVIHIETQANHTVDPLGKRCRIIERETRREEGSLEQQVRQISDRLVSLVLGNLALQLFDDRIVRIQLQRLL